MHVDEDDKTTTLIQGTGSNYMLPKLEAKGREWGGYWLGNYEKY